MINSLNREEKINIELVKERLIEVFGKEKSFEILTNVLDFYGNENDVKTFLKKIKSEEENMKKKKIMVVDDEKEIIDMIKYMLEPSGFETIACNNGLECLEKLKHIKPDIILLDIMMEPIDGWETLERIKSNDKFKNVPVCVISTLDFLTTTMRLEEKGKKELLEKIENYVSKPFIKEDLVKIIEEVLEKEN